MDAGDTLESGHRIWPELGRAQADIAFIILEFARVSIYKQGKYSYLRISATGGFDETSKLQRTFGGYIIPGQATATWVLNDKRGVHDFGAVLVELTKNPAAMQPIRCLAWLVHEYGHSEYGASTNVANHFSRTFDRTVKLRDVAHRRLLSNDAPQPIYDPEGY